MWAKIWAWFHRNAEPLQAVGGFLTAALALGALVVIPWQINQADRIQREQTAREIYREFLNLTVQKPELATADYCALKDPGQIAAYTAYAEYLLYTAEQMVDTSPGWQAPMTRYLNAHASYLCSPELLGAEGDTARLITELGVTCKPDPSCG